MQKIYKSYKIQKFNLFKSYSFIKFKYMYTSKIEEQAGIFQILHNTVHPKYSL